MILLPALLYENESRVIFRKGEIEGKSAILVMNDDIARSPLHLLPVVVVRAHGAHYVTNVVGISLRAVDLDCIEGNGTPRTSGGGGIEQGAGFLGQLYRSARRGIPRERGESALREADHHA